MQRGENLAPPRRGFAGKLRSSAGPQMTICQYSLQFVTKLVTYLLVGSTSPKELNATRAACDPLPLLRKVFVLLKRGDVARAADCYLEGLRRVLRADVERRGMTAPPRSYARHDGLLLMLRWLRTVSSDPLTAESYSIFRRDVAAAQSALVGKCADPDAIGSAAFRLTATYLEQPYFTPSMEGGGA